MNSLSNETRMYHGWLACDAVSLGDRYEVEVTSATGDKYFFYTMNKKEVRYGNHKRRSKVKVTFARLGDDPTMALVCLPGYIVGKETKLLIIDGGDLDVEIRPMYEDGSLVVW